jgi:hypothetical protein
VSDLSHRLRAGEPLKPISCNPKARIAEPESADEMLERARQIVALYRKRDRLFQGCGVTSLFADACWYMLIDLFIAGRTGRQISVSSLCIASQVPQTTALRYIAIMVEKGLIVREPDPADSRRVLLSLSSSTQETMESVLR